jgi:hypothetical protein
METVFLKIAAQMTTSEKNGRPLNKSVFRCKGQCPCIVFLFEIIQWDRNLCRVGGKNKNKKAKKPNIEKAMYKLNI